MSKLGSRDTKAGVSTIRSMSGYCLVEALYPAHVITVLSLCCPFRSTTFIEPLGGRERKRAKEVGNVKGERSGERGRCCQGAEKVQLSHELAHSAELLLLRLQRKHLSAAELECDALAEVTLLKAQPTW